MVSLLRNGLIVGIVLSLYQIKALANDCVGNALVIIDMQPYFITRGGHHERPGNVIKVSDIIARQIEAIEAARDAQAPILVLEYKGYGDTADTIKAALKAYPNVKTINKNTDGMFDRSGSSRRQAIDYLNRNGVKNLVIMGANGGACVYSSIYDALSGKLYDVYAYNKGIADFNFVDFIYPYDYRYTSWSTPRPGWSVFKEIDELNEVRNVFNCAPVAESTEKYAKSAITDLLEPSRASGSKLEDVVILSVEYLADRVHLKLHAKNGPAGSYFFLDIFNSDAGAASKISAIQAKQNNKSQLQLDLEIPSFSVVPSGSYYRSEGVKFSINRRNK